jgi:hypothetical protein
MRDDALKRLLAAMVGVPLSVLLPELSRKLQSLAHTDTPPVELSPTTKAAAVIGDENVIALRRAGIILITQEQRNAWRERHDDVCAYLAAIMYTISPRLLGRSSCPQDVLDWVIKGALAFQHVPPRSPSHEPRLAFASDGNGSAEFRECFRKQLKAQDPDPDIEE